MDRVGFVASDVPIQRNHARMARALAEGTRWMEAQDVLMPVRQAELARGEILFNKRSACTNGLRPNLQGEIQRANDWVISGPLKPGGSRDIVAAHLPTVAGKAVALEAQRIC